MEYYLQNVAFQSRNISFICSAIKFSIQAAKSKEKKKFRAEQVLKHWNVN